MLPGGRTGRQRARPGHSPGPTVAPCGSTRRSPRSHPASPTTRDRQGTAVSARPGSWARYATGPASVIGRCCGDCVRFGAIESTSCTTAPRSIPAGGEPGKHRHLLISNRSASSKSGGTKTSPSDPGPAPRTPVGAASRRPRAWNAVASGHIRLRLTSTTRSPTPEATGTEVEAPRRVPGRAREIELPAQGWTRRLVAWEVGES